MTGGQRKKSTKIAGGNGSNDSQPASAASQKPEAAALVIDCPDCKKDMEENSDALQCGLYKSWFHAECQGITKSTYKWLGKKWPMLWPKQPCALVLQNKWCKCCKGEQSSKIKELDDRVASSEVNVNNIEESLKAQQEFIQKLGQTQHEGQSTHFEKGNTHGKRETGTDKTT